MPPYVYLILAGGGFILLLAGAQWVNNRASLDNIKSRTTGDGQHGTARFATAQEMKHTYRSLPFEPELWRKGKNLPNCQGIIVGQRTRFKKTTAIVDEGDVHALMIGAAGCGKTAFFLLPNIELALAAGMSFFVSDTKGDLARWYGKIGKECYGYRVAVLDLRKPMRSDGFNMLHLVNDYIDAWKRNPADVTPKAKAEMYAKIIADTIIGDTSNMGPNRFFYESAKGLLTSVILMIAEFAEPQERHIISAFKLTQDIHVFFRAARGKRVAERMVAHVGDPSPFQQLFKAVLQHAGFYWLATASFNYKFALCVFSSFTEKIQQERIYRDIPLRGFAFWRASHDRRFRLFIVI